MSIKPKVETCDVVVLGGGDNGLLCAAYLAKAGADTRLVLKQKQWDVAGNLLTEEFQGPYHFDLMPPYMLMMAEDAPCYADLNLPGFGVKYITPDVQIAFHHTDGKALVLHRDPEKSAASIARFSEADADRFRRLFSEFKEMTEKTLVPALYVEDGDKRVSASLDDSAMGKRLAEIASQSPTQIIDSYGFEAPQVREALLYLATFWGLDPEEEGVGHVVPLWVYRLMNSTIPLAGNLAVARAFYQSFLQDGGDYPGIEEVEKILVRDGKAVGVRLNSGREIHAKAVVSALNVEETFSELVGDEHLSADLSASVDNWEWENNSLLTCFYGYKGQAPSYKSGAFDPDANEAYINIFGIEKLGDTLDVHQKTSVGTVPVGHARAMCATQFDPFHAGFGHQHGPLQTLRIEIPAPGWLFKGEWEGVRQAYLQSARELWSRYADNVVDGTLSYGGVLTPYDLEMRLPTFKQGGVKGGAYTRERIGLGGDRPEAAGYRTHIGGLFMAGASAHPGGLIYFAAGYNAAGIVADELGIQRWWPEPNFTGDAASVEEPA